MKPQIQTAYKKKENMLNRDENVISRVSISGRLLTDEQINLIGVKHNEFLLQAVKGVNWSSNDVNNDFNIFFNNLATSENINLAFEGEPKNYQDNFDIVKSHLEENNSVNYFESVDSFFSNDLEGKSVKQITLFLTSLKEEFAENTNSVRDYEAFLVYTSILKHSAVFWLPTDLGGEGHFDMYKAARTPGWKKCLTDVLESDGMSGTAGFIIGAGIAAAATGPVAPITFVAEIALGAGASSAWTWYRSINC
ncbi:hypothetical protein [Chryseobacterium sp. RR2-3-20]|uniref:hypothetical protein n=1 Tax=Chryseobacterium sp. RR2-3-20 TaxID=2787626 RepID=UPI001ADF3C1B|nr:hypothetical protein [Chryseobacterium sp. RR2-3-20]